MLTITIPETELWDETREEYIYTKRQTLQLEHSLVSISKWEGKWCKPFLSSNDKTLEETIDYVKCMTVTPNVKPEIYRCLSDENIEEINKYIAAPMTATWFSEDKTARPSREVITSEIIYYWMVALNIPFECQKWHLNRLLTLIKVCDRKNQPPKKMGKNAIMSRNAALNAARRKKIGSKG